MDKYEYLTDEDLRYKPRKVEEAVGEGEASNNKAKSKAKNRQKR